MSKILIDEATVKLVIEALVMVNRTDLSQVNLAIAAIKEAQAEQAQQKPFGYIKPGEGDYEKVFSFNRNERTGYTQEVYTTPQPAQRTWIGLTDKQIADIASSDPLTWANLNAVEHYQYFARAIEAKLKEKNT